MIELRYSEKQRYLKTYDVDPIFSAVEYELLNTAIRQPCFKRVRSSIKTAFDALGILSNGIASNVKNERRYHRKIFRELRTSINVTLKMFQYEIIIGKRSKWYTKMRCLKELS